MPTKIEETYIKNHQNSSTKYQISKNIFPNGVTHDARNLTPFPFFMSHAEGTRKWDVDDNEIIDTRLNTETNNFNIYLTHNVSF